MTKKKNSPSAKTVAPSPSWKLEDGVSYSLLSRFIGCRERFRIHAVEGAREVSAKAAMDFGTYFHDFLELHAKNPKLDFNSLVLKLKRKYLKRRTALTLLDKDTAHVLMDYYLWWFSDTSYNYIKAEDKFRVKYPLPKGPKILLRGRFDEIIDRPDGTIWIQENKTKERIVPEILEASIPWNLQTMMYATAAEIKYKKKVSGIVYNVIRKPKSKPKRGEDYKEFFVRLSETIEKEPTHYFYRWEYSLNSENLKEWQRKVFDPLLRSLVLWWESIKHDPFSPWEDENGLPNAHHWMRPFGVYDSLTLSKGDFFNLITRRHDPSVTYKNEPFPELN